MLFTKCDLVQGFTEFFDDLRKSERGQIWGFTDARSSRPVDAPLGALFAERFEEMVKTVEGRMLKRIAQEPGIARREAVYQFPQQFASAQAEPRRLPRRALRRRQRLRRPRRSSAGCTSPRARRRAGRIDQLAEKLRASFGLSRRRRARRRRADGAEELLPPRRVRAGGLPRPEHRGAQRPMSISRQQAAEVLHRRGRLRHRRAAVDHPRQRLPREPRPRAARRRRRAAHRAITSRSARERAAHPRGAPAPARRGLRAQGLRATATPPIAMTFGMYPGRGALPEDVCSSTPRRCSSTSMQPALPRRRARHAGLRARRVGETTPRAASDRQQYYDRPQAPPAALARRTQANEPALEGDIATFTSDQLAREWAARVSQGAPLDGRTRDAMQQNAQLFTGLLARQPAPRSSRATSARSPSARAVLNRTSSVDIALNRHHRATSSPWATTSTLARALGRSPEYVYQVGRAGARRCAAPSPAYGVGATTSATGSSAHAARSSAGDAWVLGSGAQRRPAAPGRRDARAGAPQYFCAVHRRVARLPAGRCACASRPTRDDALRDAHSGSPSGVQPRRTSSSCARWRRTSTSPTPTTPSASAAAAARCCASIGARAQQPRSTARARAWPANQIGRSALGARAAGPTGRRTFVHREDVERDAAAPRPRGVRRAAARRRRRPRQPGSAAPPPPPPPGTDGRCDEYQEQLALRARPRSTRTSTTRASASAAAA
ncbi:MAG: type VI secretion system protein [Nocardioides sp.]